MVAQTGEFAFKDPRHVELKGIEDPQKVYPLSISTATAELHLNA